MAPGRSFAQVVFPCLLLLTAMLVGAAVDDAASLHGPGTRLLWLNLVLITIYAAAVLWASTQRSAAWNRVFHVGAKLGLLLAAVLVANDVVELFIPVRPFALIIAPVFLAIAILAATGSATWADTHSTPHAIFAGVCCVVVAMPLFLCSAVCLHLVFAARAELPLQQPFAASGMHDAHAFLVQNILQSASEALLRFPLFAVFLSLAGVLSAKISSISPRVRNTVAWLALPLFVAGAVALNHANVLPRDQRPPFVLTGIVLAAVALSSIQTLWSALRGDVAEH